jgi:hypothetical protein
MATSDENYPFFFRSLLADLANSIIHRIVDRHRDPPRIGILYELATNTNVIDDEKFFRENSLPYQPLAQQRFPTLAL